MKAQHFTARPVKEELEMLIDRQESRTDGDQIETGKMRDSRTTTNTKKQEPVRHIDDSRYSTTTTTTNNMTSSTKSHSTVYRLFQLLVINSILSHLGQQLSYVTSNNNKQEITANRLQRKAGLPIIILAGESIVLRSTNASHISS